MKKLAVAFLIAASQAFAQPSTPAITPKPIVLRAARLFDGTSDTIVRNGVVVVQGNHIVASGTNVDIPANAQVIDLGDVT
ncbi:MAG: amidohydrolase family protein, partial [Thermoanaerobaculia bacterium]